MACSFTLSDIGHCRRILCQIDVLFASIASQNRYLEYTPWIDESIDVGIPLLRLLLDRGHRLEESVGAPTLTSTRERGLQFLVFKSPFLNSTGLRLLGLTLSPLTWWIQVSVEVWSDTMPRDWLKHIKIYKFLFAHVSNDPEVTDVSILQRSVSTQIQQVSLWGTAGKTQTAQSQTIYLTEATQEQKIWNAELYDFVLGTLCKLLMA